MKQVFTGIVLLFGFMNSHAQGVRDTSFYISITDPNFVPAVADAGSYITLDFHDDEVNTIVSNYTIHGFSQPYASSNYENLRQLYIVTTSSAQLIQDLNSYNNAVFPGGSLVPDVVPCYTPNDFGKAWSGVQSEMDMVHARQAWDSTKGNASVKIGVNDGIFNVNHKDLNGKIAKVYSNNNRVNFLKEHGTNVLGIIAAKTDNDTGMASIGYRCLISNFAGAQYILEIFMNTIRIF